MITKHTTTDLDLAVAGCALRAMDWDEAVLSSHYGTVIAHPGIAGRIARVASAFARPADPEWPRFKELQRIAAAELCRLIQEASDCCSAHDLVRLAGPRLFARMAESLGVERRPKPYLIRQYEGMLRKAEGAGIEITDASLAAYFGKPIDALRDARQAWQLFHTRTYHCEHAVRAPDGRPVAVRRHDRAGGRGDDAVDGVEALCDQLDRSAA